MNGINKATPRAHRLAVALGGTLLLMPQVGFSALFVEATDAELSTMRGRYVPGPSQIVYFGVEMITRWQTMEGRGVDAGLNLSVDSQLNPTITVVNLEHTNQGDSTALQPAVSGNMVSINSGGLTEGRGVTQSIQIGGDGNAVRNDVGMNITFSQGDAPIVDGAGLQLNTVGSQTINNSNGSITTVSLDRNGLKLAVDVPGQGQVLQQLRTGNGVFQGAMIGGDLNRIHNAISINATLRSMPGLNIASMQSALDSLKGMRQTGMF